MMCFAFDVFFQNTSCLWCPHGANKYIIRTVYIWYIYYVFISIFERRIWTCPLSVSCETVLSHLRREILRVRGVALELITEVHRWRGMIWYCWWFRNLANQLRLVIFSHYLQGFWDHPRWLLGISEPSTVWNAEIYEIILTILKHRQEYYRQHIIFICDL